MHFEFHLLPHNHKTHKEDKVLPVWKPFYKGSSPFLKFISENALYLLSFLLPVIVLLVLLAYNDIAPFGDKCFFVLNGAENLSILNNFISKVQSGNFSLFAQGGTLGNEYFSVILFYLCSPLHLVLAFFSQKTAIILLTIITILQIGFSGFAMAFYLTRRLGGNAFSKYNLTTLVFSLGYALSSCMLLQYNDFMYMDCAMLFPILMLTYEQLLYKNKKTPFILLLACLTFSNFFIASVSAVFLLLHMLTRKKGDLHQACACVRRYLFSVISAALLSGITLIPGFYALYQLHIASPLSYQSKIAISVWPDFAFITDWLSFFSRFFPGNYGSYATTASYGSNLYCGLFITILLCFYLTDKKLSMADRVRNLLFIAALFLLTNITSLQFVARLFTNNNAIFNCFSFIVVFYILSICAEAFYDLKENQAYKMLISFLLPFILYLLASLYATDYVNSNSMVCTLILFISYGLLLLFYQIGSIGAKTFYCLLAFLMLGELAGNSAGHVTDISLESPKYTSYITDRQENNSLKKFLPFTMEQLSEDISSKDSYFVMSADTEVPQHASTIFEEQNKQAAFLGADTAIFTPANLSITHTASENIFSQKTTTNIFTLLVLPDTPNSKVPYNNITLTITPDRSGDLYLYTNELTRIGDVTAGKSFKRDLNFSTLTNLHTNYWIHGAYLNRDVMSDLQKKISSHSLSVIETGLTSARMLVKTDADGKLLLSIPLSSFISFYVDGEAVRAEKYTDNITLLPVPAGEHILSVRLHYTPFYVGLFLTMLSILVCLAVRKSIAGTATIKQYISQKLRTACHCVEIFCLKHSTGMYSFFIPLLFLLVCYIVTNVAPFGSNSFFKSDGAILTIPTFFQEIHQLRKGSFFYSWTSGGGSNIFYTLPTMLFNYWLLLIPENSLCEWLTIIETLKIALCGFTCYLYFTRRRVGKKFHRQDYRLLMFTTAYSLSSYMICMRGFFFWIDLLLLFPLLLLSLDKLMLEKKKSLYILLLTIAIVCNYYIALYLCIFLVLTFFTYHFEGFKDFIRKGLRFALSSITAAGICFFVLFATYMGMQTGSYSQMDSVLPKFTFYQSFWDSLKQGFALAETITVTPENGAINLYCGVFCLLLTGIYALASKRSKVKYLKLAFMGFVLFSSNNHVLSYIWNGFHYQSKVPNRYSFLLIFLMLDVSCEAVYLLKNCSRKKLCLAFAGSLAVVILSTLFADKKPALYSSITTGILLTAFFLLLLFITRMHTHRMQLHKCFLSIALAELCACSCFSFYQSDTTIGYNEHPTYSVASMDYLKELYLGDNLMERVNFLGPSTTNYCMVSNVNSLNQFNSFLSKYQAVMGNSIGSFASTNYLISNNNLTPFSNALTGVRYIVLDEFTPYGYMDLEHYTPIACYQNSVILENPRALSLGFFAPYETHVFTEDVQKTEDFITQFASSYVPDSSILSDTVTIFNETAEGADPINNYTLITDYANDTTMQTIHFVPEKSGEYYLRMQEFFYLGYLDAGHSYDFTIPVNVESPGFISLYHEDEFKAFYAESSKYPLKISNYSDTTIDGSITLPKDGCIYLSIPYEQGWTAYVDGVKTPTSYMSNGAMFLTATKGTHQLHLEFKPVGFTTGITVSVLFLGIYFLILVSELLLPRLKSKRKAAAIAAARDTDII